MRSRLLALGAATLTTLGLATWPAHAEPDTHALDLDAAFAQAAQEYDVPRDLLVAVGHNETRLDGHGGQPSQDNGFGVMHLVDNPTSATLAQAADLTGASLDALRSHSPTNIRGAAAVLDALADDAGLTDRASLDQWYPVVASYGSTLSANDTFALLREGLATRAPDGEIIGFPAHRSLPARATSDDLHAQGPDYPDSRWIPAHGANYGAGRSAAINQIVIHVTQGSYAGTISWFQNPSSGVSAHYVVKSSNGEVTQMVRDGDTAYHARSANPRTLGIEHEGFVDNPAWFTESMYRSSAALTRWLADRHGIPKTRQGIVGHNEVPGNDHTDPGPHWNWGHYLDLVNGGGSSGGVFTGSSTDFDGDGRDDIVTFTHGPLDDVYVALSSGAGFTGTTVKWHDRFALSGETPLTGDFNGDGRDDIVTFTHGSLTDVYVALSTGSSFGPGQKWHDFFALNGEVPAVGDVNGDGRDDIITFTRNNLADVYVALSTGTSFGASQKWHDFFGIAGEYPGVADVNGDGRDDIVVFTRGTLGDVYVALSTGSGFGASAKWHDWFSVGGELPRIGDFNGDGKADIATFTVNAAADVYVALSNGSAFVGTEQKWNDFFGIAGEFPYTGDFNGDGRDDVVTFTHNNLADVYTALSTGTAFGGGAKWHDYFGLPGETSF
ncbi:N-acetylmuramoyl-L-alanine amidase [Actinophytocola xinjiangensis]|uniref:N-acetylmuramoyl-L-alanine amidase n=1 Tax=Actinophytocola xinjiangensis TaxID=485602 RepID=A0A7Z0WNF7_9PSEU|nr:N-acetylmuramoyl-L-alanine amidase [Actinophytocola xinjiangensis]OLF11577.1 N-acetylmuramoyl-L-alanine amidase [Actinophytocola xinjiangensis]